MFPSITRREALLSKCIAEALVAQPRREAEAQGVDVVTWLMRDKSKDEYGRAARGPGIADSIACPSRYLRETTGLRGEGAHGCQ